MRKKREEMEVIGIRISKKLADQFRELGEMDNRTLQDTIRMGLERAIPLLKARFEAARNAERKET